MPKHKQAGQTTVLTKMTAEITRKHLQCRSHPQRTFPTLVFGHVADAAFARSCSDVTWAAQQISPNQPFGALTMSWLAPVASAACPLKSSASGLSDWGVHRVSRSFAMGFSLAAPFLIGSMVYNLTLGVINRAMPALMVAFVGAPVVTFGGLAILMVASPMILDIWSTALMGFFANPGEGMP